MYNLIQEAVKIFKPPPELTVSEWADQERRLSPEASAEPGRWDTSRAEYQRGIMDAISDANIHTVVIMSCTQVGKALDVNTSIATPTGWSTMGDLEVGDIVYGMNGEPVNVSYVSPVYKNRRCYNVKFSDGSSIVADHDHQWYVEPHLKKPCVLTTGEIVKDFKIGTRNWYAIPVAGAIKTSKKKLPIDPYVLGAWLGDGHSWSSRIYASVDDADFMAEQISNAGHRVKIKYEGCAVIRIDPKRDDVCPYGHDKKITGWSGRGCRVCTNRRSKNYLRKKRGLNIDPRPPLIKTLPRLLASCGLLKNKHIPVEYLRSSYGQRLSLLQGLMDTDGYIGVNGRSEFVTTSKPIADGFGELISTLGIKYTVAEKIPTTTYLGKQVEGAKAYRFNFTVYDNVQIFRMPRKLERMVSKKGRRTSETLRRRIVDVRLVETRPVRCIQVDSNDHLFLAGVNMIPTHNTEIINNTVGYYIDQDPAPILLIQPTLDIAHAWSKDRLAPMLRDTPALHDTVQDVKSRASGNTLLHKTFPGGHITIAGANAASGLASRPIRILLCDEIDKYPISAGTEGDPVKLAKKRTATFWNKKHIYVSTPTIKGMSRIEDAFEESDKRYFFVPCPECGEDQILVWQNVKWEKGNPSSAIYTCEFCGSVWNDVVRWRAVHHGQWFATAIDDDTNKIKKNNIPKNIGTAGFHLNEIYSPWVTLSDMAKDWLSAKKKPDTLKTFINTSLAETWEESGESVDNTGLMERREPYEHVSDQVAVLTCGVDVQPDRLEYEVVGHGLDYETWGIEQGALYGDPNILQTTSTKNSPWDALEKQVIKRLYERNDGVKLWIKSTCIDSGGHNTKAVYKFCKARENTGGVFAIKGRGGDGPSLVSRPSRNNSSKVNLFFVYVDKAKDELLNNLNVEIPGPGYCHFPMEYDSEYFIQLTSEKKVVKYRAGVAYSQWVKKKAGAKNEALDRRVYAMAALEIINIDLNIEMDRIHATAHAVSVGLAPVQGKRRRVRNAGTRV